MEEKDRRKGCYVEKIASGKRCNILRRDKEARVQSL